MHKENQMVIKGLKGGNNKTSQEFCEKGESTN